MYCTFSFAFIECYAVQIYASNKVQYLTAKLLQHKNITNVGYSVMSWNPTLPLLYPTDGQRDFSGHQSGGSGDPLLPRLILHPTLQPGRLMCLRAVLSQPDRHHVHVIRAAAGHSGWPQAQPTSGGQHHRFMNLINYIHVTVHVVQSLLCFWARK